jgi:hypothetical protein
MPSDCNFITAFQICNSDEISVQTTGRETCVTLVLWKTSRLM